MIEGMTDEIAAYLGRHPEDRGRLGHLLDQVADDPAIGERSNMRGHVVSSIMTLDSTRTRALLIHHKAYGIWIPPGGHYEGGTLYESGMRERSEETGLSASRPYPGPSPYLIDIDTHPIAARPSKGEGPHRHHDFMYLEVARGDVALELQASEVLGCRFIALDDLSIFGHGRMARLARRLRDLA